MSEIGDVLAAIEALSAKGERMALATIVAVRGSTYRRPGARLLVPEEGAPWGLSGAASRVSPTWPGWLWRRDAPAWRGGT